MITRVLRETILDHLGSQAMRASDSQSYLTVLRAQKGALWEFGDDAPNG